MSEYLLEIGSEELPSDYIEGAKESLKVQFEQLLQESQLRYQSIQSYATPRRLILFVKGLEKQTKKSEVIVTGPPRSRGQNKDGSYTKAADGFAKSKGLLVDDLEIIDKNGVEFLGAKITINPKNSVEIIRSEVERLVLGIGFAKTMVWGDTCYRYPRPIKWVLSLFDSKECKVSIAGIKSSNRSYGHRFLTVGSINVDSIDDYISKTRSGYLLIDAIERQERIIEEARRLADLHNATVVEDQSLLETVSYLTEWPIPLIGKFDEKYLKLPDEVLILLMKKHQKMFGLRDLEGRLINRFITIANTIVTDEAVVIRGYERVLKARLEDAKFFYQEDMKVSLKDFAKRQDKVTYHKKLGTVQEKVTRVGKLATVIAKIVDKKKVGLVTEAAKIYKADLESLMVFEFPELQGAIGRRYALDQGMDSEVADAIFESYLPRFASDDLPKSKTGVILALADKIESLTGCFMAGLIPTASQDPFALRRTAIGIIQIIIDSELTLSISDLIQEAQRELAKLPLSFDIEKVRSIIIKFIHGRLQSDLLKKGEGKDIIDSIFAIRNDDILDISHRFNAMIKLQQTSFYQPLVITFKRVSNIAKSGSEAKVDPKLFESKSENVLYEKIVESKKELAKLLADKNYFAYLEEVSKLRGYVDTFFDETLVMVPDIKLRENRLALLGELLKMLLEVADFSRINI
ncbi:MAG: glycine--tRNA ligase subunit beta [Nitrospinota bacterium]